MYQPKDPGRNENPKVTRRALSKLVGVGLAGAAALALNPSVAHATELPMESVDTISALRNARIFSPTQTADVLGYYAPGDGGGGVFFWDPNAMQPDNGGTVIQSNQSLTGRWRRVVDEWVSVKWFGAKGDGIADDTVAIQAAINAASAAGGGTVAFGGPQFTYLITKQRTKLDSVGVSVDYCLQVPSNVWLDLHGATIKLANTQNAVMIINQNIQANTDTNIQIKNGIIDGNAAGQTSIVFNSHLECIYWNGLTKSVMDNIRFENPYQYAGFFTTVSFSVFDRLTCYNSRGSGFQWGTTPNRYVTDLVIGDIAVYNSSGLTSDGVNGAAGSMAVFSAQRCTIGSLYSVNNVRALKFQSGCADLEIDQAIVIGVTGSQAFKLQWDGGADPAPTRCHVGKVCAKGCINAGLYLEQCQYCTVDSYIGEGNATSGQYPDVWVSGPHLQIGSIKSRGAGAEAVLLRNTAQNFWIGSVFAEDMAEIGGNSAGAVVSIAGSSGYIGMITCNDTRGGGAVAKFCLKTTHPNDVVHVGDVRGNGLLFNGIASAPIWVGAGKVRHANPEKGSVQITGTSTSGTVTLINKLYDTNCKITLTTGIAGGAPALGSNRAFWSNKMTDANGFLTGFTINLEAAPGIGTVQVDWECGRWDQ